MQRSNSNDTDNGEDQGEDENDDPDKHVVEWLNEVALGSTNERHLASRLRPN